MDFKRKSQFFSTECIINMSKNLFQIPKMYKCGPKNPLHPQMVWVDANICPAVGLGCVFVAL